MRKYRFFYHYRHATKSLTVHFRGKCYSCQDVQCEAPTESKWNKTQPTLVMQGYCNSIEEQDNKIIIKNK